MIIFNGISSDEVGVIVEHYPKVIFPKRKVEVYNIPGRNGDRIMDQEVYENYDQPYEIFFDSKDRGGLEAMMPKIASWLLSGTGYCRLEDSYFPEFYRMAYVPDAHEFLSYFNEYGRGTLTFNCAPERWYKSGDIEIEIQNGQTFYNPSGFKAWPLFRFGGNGANLTIKHIGEYIPDQIPSIGDITYTQSIGSSYSGITYFDPKEHSIYTYNHTNTSDPYKRYDSSGQYIGEYEPFYLGKITQISWNSNTKIYMKPRWWTI
jgi:phage-related protein